MEITIKDAATIMNAAVARQLRGEKMSPIMLWGAPGIGKSDLVRQVASTHAIEVLDIRLAQMDPVDLRGIPEVKEGITRWAAPDFLPREKDSKGILFLDELSSADPSIQVAAYQLILDRRIGNYGLPDGWYVCAAGNRAEDQAVSMPMSSALANRLLHLELTPDLTVWGEWAITHGIDPIVVAFLRFRPEAFSHMEDEKLDRGWPSPRSWAGVSMMLEMGLPEKELRACVEGLVGENAALQFFAFRKQCTAMSDVRAAMLDPTKPIRIPNKPDQRYALATAMPYWLWRGKDEDESKLLLDGFFRISLMLPGTFAVVAMLDAMESGDDSRAKILTEHPGFQQWNQLHGETFSKRSNA